MPFCSDSLLCFSAESHRYSHARAVMLSLVMLSPPRHQPRRHTAPSACEQEADILPELQAGAGRPACPPSPPTRSRPGGTPGGDGPH